MKASPELAVWWCVSPKYTRVGNLRPAYGEYVFFASTWAGVSGSRA